MQCNHDYPRGLLDRVFAIVPWFLVHRARPVGVHTPASAASSQQRGVLRRNLSAMRAA
jgi:hypothetical protein